VGDDDDDDDDDDNDDDDDDNDNNNSNGDICTLIAAAEYANNSRSSNFLSY
jgi:hypothetical protein